MASPDLSNPYNSCNFIDLSTQQMLQAIPSLITTKEYFLFYFIKDDIYANLLSLYNTDTAPDFIGFPTIRKNTRHAIEAFFDLYNLCTDPDYITVLKYCAGYNRPPLTETDKTLLNEKYQITNPTKNGFLNIAEKYNLMHDGAKHFQHLLKIAQTSNAYVHPNVFVSIIQNDIHAKTVTLQQYLNANFQLLYEAYQLLFNKFCSQSQHIQPVHFNCIHCTYTDHNKCHQCTYQSILNTIKNNLFIEVYPPTPNFPFAHY